MTTHREFEKALRESEERYRAVVEQSVEAIYLYDLESKRVIESNEAFQQMIGYAADELLGKTVYEFIDHPDRDIDAHIERTLRRGRRRIGERRYRRKDGSIILVDTSASVITYEGKTAICAVSRDVTERRSIEEAREQSEKRFRSLIRNATDIITIMEPDGTIRYDSPAIERVLGYGQEERIGRNVFDYAHPDDRERSRRSFRQAVAAPGVQPSLEIRMRHRDGTWRYVDSTRTNLIDDPAIRGIVANSRDITERKEAQEALLASEARFRAVFDRAAIGMALVDAEGVILEANEALQEMLGCGAEVLRGRHFNDVTHPDDVSEDEELFERLMAGEIESFRIEKRYLREDGEPIWGLLTSSAVHSEEGCPEFMVGMVENVTERRRAEAALRESERRYRTLIETSVESIYLFDVETKRILESNAALHDLLGYTAGELLGMETYDFVDHEGSEIDLTVEQHLMRGRRFVGERTYRAKDGAAVEVEASATLIPYEGGAAVCVVARDVTERKALEEQLREQAFSDSVTGLPNRALFVELAEKTLKRGARNGGETAILFVDLDNFKVVNDSLGHDAGNDLLRAVAETLKGCVRPSDTVARIFGDEFAALLEDAEGVSGARRVAQRMEDRLRTPFEIGMREVFVTASIGIALGRPGQGAADLLRNADLAMYAAKGAGKARSEIYMPSMNTRAVERMELENDLRRAVKENEFFVHYQPIVAAEGGEVEGLEALVRWQDPERGTVLPSEFITIAEQTGLIVPMGEWVLREVCRQVQGWEAELGEGALPTISVNLSARQFYYQPEAITDVFEETGVDPRRVRFEITERAVMDNAEFAIGKIEKMRNLGVRFAIDDFGTGYSCLHYLKRLPVDVLKIDGSFVRGLEHNSEDRAIVEGTVSLGHALGLRVVGEHVETAGQLGHLRRMGCDLAQGYLFSGPLPPDEVPSVIVEGLARPTD